MLNGITLWGTPNDPLVSGIEICCIEKQVPYRKELCDPGDRGIRRKNPFLTVPIVEWGDTVLYEPWAIATFLDERFDGPVMQPPTGSHERAMMTQWGAVIINRIAPAVHGLTDDQPDPTIPIQLATADKALAQANYLAGGKLTLADCLLAPCIASLAQTASGRELLATSYTWLNRWVERMAQRQSYRTAMLSTEEVVSHD
ncbi:MAG: glutathione S-transferase family protein [Pseudomonadota bacterium]